MAEKRIVEHIREAFETYVLHDKLVESVSELSDAVKSVVKESHASLPQKPKVLLIGPSYRGIIEVGAVVIGLQKPCDIDVYELNPTYFDNPSFVPFTELFTRLQSVGSSRRAARGLFANSTMTPHVGPSVGDADKAQSGYDVVAFFNMPPPNKREQVEGFMSKLKSGGLFLLSSAEKDAVELQRDLQASPLVGNIVLRQMTPPIGTGGPGKPIGYQDVSIAGIIKA